MPDVQDDVAVDVGVDESGGEIQHAVECGNCGRDTYEWERYCHRCGHDRWSHA